ncbi:hypothetical protein ILUMI_06404 [Ignelater luminosus]|uniref:YqaJ viral recombinase domain-containing protein n=1 Tax=Ignelater luminosus TaxID=2038154 RepID=A0A8K0D5H9_IGNLU|nr:hypothetical protein ILUMI_06404 [Ignelater luminosus]
MTLNSEEVYCYCLMVPKQLNWLGFSPGGIVFKDNKPIKLLEIKCPYSGLTDGPEMFCNKLKYLVQASVCRMAFGLTMRTGQLYCLSLNMVLDSKSRKIINSILQFMKREADAGAPMIPFSKVQQRVSAATGISLRTINRVAKEGREIEKGEKPSFSTPNKIRKNRKSKVALDDFDKDSLCLSSAHTQMPFYKSWPVNSKNIGVQLKQRHQYYGQIQLGLAILNLQVCDFVVYSAKSNSFLKLEIPFDEKFASNLILAITKKILHKYVTYFVQKTEEDYFNILVYYLL